MKITNYSSVILINKPTDWTSFDVINKLRYTLIRKLRLDSPQMFEDKKCKLKVGHAGTLDPLATGLLIVCVGSETKNIDKYMGMEKEYTGTFFLGATRPSFDNETEVDSTFEISHITEENIFDAAKKFIGKTQQMPPVYSAVKVNGKRAYQSARKGEDVKMEPRIIIITEFEITKIELPLVYFRIVCSKGTYIRSIADDFGKALNSGAFLNSLVRTRIGEFKLENAKELEDFVKSIEPI